MRGAGEVASSARSAERRIDGQRPEKPRAQGVFAAGE